MSRPVDDDALPGESGAANEDDEAFSGLPIPAKGSLLLGKYRVEGVVGVGGMGMVVAARHEHLNERVALKMLLPTYAKIEETRKRFQREAQAAYKLRSEHVCRVLDAGDLEDGTPFIAMEFLKGDDLAILIRKKKRFAVGEAVEYILQACEALSEAHANDIVHRDLKPANLVIVSRKDGARLLKVIDFGISKVSSQGSSLTNTYGYLGSPSYSAPEQFASTRAMTASGDIWSLGVILYELVCGVSPFVFPGDTLAEMATTITYEPAVPMTQRDPTIDPAFERVVLRCLEKEPANRHARVRELAEAIAPWAGTPPDDLLSRIRRNQPGAIAGHAPSQPQRTADVPAPAIRSSTVALASAPPPQAAAYAPSASMPPPPPGITRYAVAADPPPRAARSSVWIPMTLAALGAVVGIASVAAYRTAHHVVPASSAAPSAVLTAPVVPPEPVASAATSAAPSGTSAVAASVTPSASASSSARTTPSARPTASGRVPPRHPVPAPAESGPKILKDRDGKF